MKTMKYLPGLILSCVLLLGSCAKDDIDELRRQQAEIAQRVASLEAWKQTVNTNITALQGLVAALEANDYITGVTPKIEGGVEVGYTITFSKSGSIVIYNGKDGADGLTPVIGVKQDTDGRYYWTVQTGTAPADWLRDDKGNKIPTTGADGQDAIAPQVRINSVTGEWEISTTGGSTWTSTGVEATGPAGPQGLQGQQGPQGPQGDAVFAANGVDNNHADYVEFTLADGTKIQVSKYIAMGITFEQPDAFNAGETLEITYTVTGSPTIIVAVGIPQGWKVVIDKENTIIRVTSPSTFTDDNKGGDVVILVSDGGDHTVTRLLTLATVDNNVIGAYYYLDGVKVGVVFQVKTADRKGLVVSLDEKFVVPWGPQVTSNATSTTDGTANMAAVKVVNSDYSNYEAFQWVYQKNGNADGPWYLPAKDELKALCAGYCGLDITNISGWSDGNGMPGYASYSEARTTFDGILTSADGTAITTNTSQTASYWSSTESDSNKAWAVWFSTGNTDTLNKTNGIRVRAILAY